MFDDSGLIEYNTELAGIVVVDLEYGDAVELIGSTLHMYMSGRDLPKFTRFRFQPVSYTVVDEFISELIAKRIPASIEAENWGNDQYYKVKVYEESGEFTHTISRGKLPKSLTK